MIGPVEFGSSYERPSEQSFRVTSGGVLRRQGPISKTSLEKCQFWFLTPFLTPFLTRVATRAHPRAELTVAKAVMLVRMLTFPCKRCSELQRETPRVRRYRAKGTPRRKKAKYFSFGFLGLMG